MPPPQTDRLDPSMVWVEACSAAGWGRGVFSSRVEQRRAQKPIRVGHRIQNTDELRCFALPSRTGRPLGLFFYKKEGAVGPAPKARVRSLAAEGGQMEELKTCLREYRLPQRAINGRSRVPKAAFNQTGLYSNTPLPHPCWSLNTPLPRQ